MYSRKRPDSHRFMGGRSHVFCFDFRSLGTWLFSTTVKVVGTSHTSGGFDKKYPAFAHTICLRKMPHSVAICIRYRLGWIMAYIMRPFVERLSLSPTAYSQIVAQQRSMPKCTIIVSQLAVFYPMFFQYFFVGCDPQNVYCRQSSCLDLGTAQGMISQLTSDPVSTTHQILIWSPPTLLYRNWLLIRSRTPIRCQK